MSKTSGRFSRYPAVNRDGKQQPKPAAGPDFAAMTIADVLEWVGDDEARRAEALAAEQAGKARSTLIDALSGDA
jgi:hypothetical protein